MADEREMILTNLRKGVLEFCVLSALRNGSEYGRQLAHVLGEQGLLASEGSLYPLLSRLRGSGLVESTVTETEGRPRRYYSLTASGRARFEAFSTAWAPFRDTVDHFLEG
jgi:PadR family transcriptional regulator, regulatory protein PadR